MLLRSHMIRQARPTSAWAIGRWFPIPILLVASVLFRLPALLNARGIDSDAAIVGLQALHVLRGEWSWFLWGAGYQSSVDALLVSIAFTIGGPEAITMMAVPMIGHLLLTWFTFDLLRRRLELSLAFILTLVIVFAPRAVNTVALYPPRQWCITSVIAAIWLLDGASESPRPGSRYAAGMFMATLALYLDLFALQFMPGLGVFAVACSLDGKAHRRIVLKRAGCIAVGFMAGLLLLWILRHQPGSAISSAGAASASTNLSLQRIPTNFKLLWSTCLPVLLGYKVFMLQLDLHWAQWNPPLLVRIFQVCGAASLLLGVLGGGVAIFLRRVPWPVRRLGLLGFSVTLCSLGGFLVSTMPVDLFGARYLAPIIWTAPFALAPVAFVLGKERSLGGLVPYLAVAAIAGWLSFSPYVRGLFPVRTPQGVAADEVELGNVLRQQGIKSAAADYWLAYRLTFLWNEDPVVASLDRRFDRYRPYQRAFDSSPSVALIFRPAEQGVLPEPYAAELKRSGTRFERIEVADFVILIVHRGAPGIEVVPGDGWSHVEPWGMWVSRTKADASWYAADRRAARVTIAARPICSPGKQQRVTINVNGVALTSHEWTNCDLWRGSVLIPAQLVQQGWNAIMFQTKFSAAASSSVGGARNDPRSLVLAVSELGIQSIDR